MTLKQSVKQNIGQFSKREFREAVIYAAQKYRQHPLQSEASTYIKEQWYWAVVVGEVILQRRFMVFTKLNYQVSHQANHQMRKKGKEKAATA